MWWYGVDFLIAVEIFVLCIVGIARFFVILGEVIL